MINERASGNVGPVEVSCGLAGHSVIDYDRRRMRKALVGGAAIVRKEARRLVSRRAVSAPFEAPGLQTGRLRRAIGVVTRGSKGGWIKIGVKSIKGSVFYPAPLFYGSAKIGLAPRENYVATAADNKRSAVRDQVRGVLADSLVPR